MDYNGTKGYGFHPFCMISKTNNEVSMAAIECPDSGVMGVYKIVKKFLQTEPDFLHLAIDFPKRMGLKNDYIGVFTVIDKDVQVSIIPYSIKTGERFPIIRDHMVVDFMLREFEMSVYGKTTILNQVN